VSVRAIGHTKAPVNCESVAFLTTSGPLGTAFKPSRDRGNPYRTGVTGPAQVAEGRWQHSESGLGALRRGTAGGRGTAFKPCPTPTVRRRRRRPRPVPSRRRTDRLAGSPIRRPPHHDPPAPQLQRRATTARRPQDDRPRRAAGRDPLSEGRVTQGRRIHVRHRRKNSRPRVQAIWGPHPAAAPMAIASMTTTSTVNWSCSRPQPSLCPMPVIGSAPASTANECRGAGSCEPIDRSATSLRCQMAPLHPNGGVRPSIAVSRAASRIRSAHAPPTMWVVCSMRVAIFQWSPWRR